MHKSLSVERVKKKVEEVKKKRKVRGRGTGLRSGEG